MIALLVFSAIEAYRIQELSSRQSAEIYHRYAQTGDVLFRIRRLLFLGSIDLRDQFLSREPDRVQVFSQQIAVLRSESDSLLREFEQAKVPGSSPEELRRRMADFWTVLASTNRWTERRRKEDAYDFVQSEIVPRRNAAGQLLRSLVEANNSALKDSETKFALGRRNATVHLLTIVGLCILTALVVALLIMRHAERLEAETARRFGEVEAARQDLRHLSARLLDIQEDERRRLSRELHDEIGQTLTALRIEISHAQAAWRNGAPSVSARLEQARALAEKTVESVRNISLLLRPSLLDDLGLEPALHWLCEDFARRSGVRCAFAGDGLERELPDAHKTCVYRVIQEALHNCEKHSGAGHVAVALQQKPSELTVEVRDNGRGFALDKHGAPLGSAGLGILGMRERVASLGGALNIRSSPGEGTRILVSLPLAASPAAAAAGAVPAGSQS